MDRAKEWGIKALEKSFEGFSGTVIVHVCRSYPDKEEEEKNKNYKSDQGYYPELLDLLQKTKINQISIEGKQGNLDPAVVKHLGDKTVLYGCIDVGTEKVETVEEIVLVGKEILKHIKPEQLVLSPDCGLIELSRESAKAKLSNLAKAANELNSL